MEDEPLPEATKISGQTGSADVWAAQGQPLPVYAQPLDEAVLDEQAYFREHQYHGYNGIRRHESGRNTNDSSDDDDYRPSATRHETAREAAARRDRSRCRNVDGAEDDHYDRELWGHGIVIVSTPGLGGGGVLRLAVLCFIYSIFCLAMLIIHIQWVREDEEMAAQEESMAENEREDMEEYGYEEYSDDEYYERERDERQSQENFEVLFRFFSFLVYLMIALAQRGLSHLNELYVKQIYIGVSRGWIGWTILSLVVMLVLDSMIRDQKRADQLGDHVDWEEYDAQIEAYNGLLLTSDILNLFFFSFSSYVFHRTFLRIKQMQEGAHYEPPSN